jgi:hypothetical protein
MIRFDCPHCRKGLRTEDSMAGTAFNCPGCRGRVRVPQASVEFVADAGRDQATGSERARFVVRPFRPLPILSAQRLKSIVVWSLLAALIAGGAMELIAVTLELAPWQSWLLVGFASLAAAIVAIVIASIASLRPHCPICHRWKKSRHIGSIQRDAISAKEALEAGDLAALRALSPEGVKIFVGISQCRKCSTQAPIEILFATQLPDLEATNGVVELAGCGLVLLAHVTYPGSAFPAFERLAKKG